MYVCLFILCNFFYYGLYNHNILFYINNKLIIFKQIWIILNRKLTKFEPKCSGPGFFVEIQARPKIWRLVSTKRKILRLVSTRRQVLTDMVKFARGLSQATRATGGESERMDLYSLPYRCQNPSCQRHVWGMMFETQ